MFDGYYAEHVIRDRERERARALAESRMLRTAHPARERPVLSADWRGWSWRQASAVLGRVGVALPASLQGDAWGLREILGLLIR